MKTALLAAVLTLAGIAPPVAAQSSDTAIAVPGMTVSELKSFIDTEAAVGRLRKLNHAPAAPAAWMFTIHYSGQTGAADSVRPYFPGRLPEAAVDSVRSILLGTARHIAPEGKPVSHTVVALPGEDAAIRPPAEQPPILRNRPEVIAALTRFSRQHRRDPDARALGTVTVKVRVRIDSAGIPTAAVIPTPGPLPWIDAEIQRLAYTLRFQPARVEGEAVALWVELPLNLPFR